MMKKIVLSLLAVLCTVITALAQATPPASATIETWQATYSMTSSYGTDEATEPMQVAFDGSDVYFNLLNPLTGSTWVKGTISGDKAVFAKGQTIGSYGGVTYCLAGSSGSEVTDVEFYYDAANGVFSLVGMYLLLNNGTTSVSYVAYFSVLTITRDAQQPEDPQEGQTPPASAEKATWSITYTFTSGGESETGTEPMEVAFAGSSVYFNFPNPIKGNTWMRGTLSGQTLTFARGQEVGTYGGTTVYYMGLGEGDALTDIVFYYDEAEGIFTLGDNWLLLNGSLTQNYALGYFSAATITRGGSGEQKPVTVTPPEGMRTSVYELTATRIWMDAEGWMSEPVSCNLRLGVSGNDVYMQGLCQSLPDAWIKGKRNVSDGELTFPSGQYYGSPATAYDLYFAAADYPTTNPTWADAATFSYDAASVTYTAHGLLALNSSATELRPYEFLAGAKFTKATGQAAIAAVESAVESVAYTDLQGRPVTSRQKGLVLKTVRRADGKQTTVKMLR